MNLACVLTVKGELKPLPKREPTLEECQKIVGGDIQVIEIKFLNEPGQMVVDEYGKLKHYPPNLKATAIALTLSGISADDYIVGDVVILMGNTRLR